MIHIDGSAKSGSGTILRYALALSSLLGVGVHIENIRAKRDKPGLRPQHLASVTACAEMCNAQVEGAVVDSREIIYKPGASIRGGRYQWEIGTAGSTTLLLMTLLPIALFTRKASIISILGGLFQDFAPSAHHMEHVLFPTLKKMGIQAGLEIIRPGYVPRGGGIIRAHIIPVGSIKPMKLLRQGMVTDIEGLALSSHLRQQRVSQRMVEECQKMLVQRGFQVRIETLWDETALQPGASLAIWSKTDSGCILGSDQAGKRGRSSESISNFVARTLLEDVDTGATVDRYLADQLIIYAALATGITEYTIPRWTDHVETNLWLIERFGARSQLRGTHLRIEGIGYNRR